MNLLEIEGLTASIDGTAILRGLDLALPAGQVHAIMGPNGAGKSTLAHVLAGRDDYEVSGSVRLDGVDLLAMSPEERAVAGLFLAFQHPVEIPGVGNSYFLRTALNAVREARGEDPLDAMDFMAYTKDRMALVEMDASFLSRSVNEGFSGGERKRNEILQMAILEPRMAILDETDSGLDIDALRIVAHGANSSARTRPVDARDHPPPAAARRAGTRRGPRAGRRSDRPHRVGPIWHTSSKRVATPGSTSKAPGDRADTRPDDTPVTLAELADVRPVASIVPGDPAREPEWLSSLRSDAADYAVEHGYPTRKHEDWRYVRLDGLLDTAFVTPAAGATDATAADPLLRRLLNRVPDLGGNRIVFVDGRFAPGLSRLVDTEGSLGHSARRGAARRRRRGPRRPGGR